MTKSTKRSKPQQNGKATAANVKELPSPFSTPPEKLTAFLETLEKSKVYAVHLDTLPWEFKRRIFAVPVFMNLVFAALLLWRAYAMYPTYLDLLLIAFGQKTKSTVVDVGSKPTSAIAWLIIRRTLMILFDFVLTRFVVPWPYSFFFEAPANPVSWRRKVPFQNTEIIVRQSRKWGTEDVFSADSALGERNPFFKVRILPAVDRKYLRDKTGYLMMGKDWDLDFASMIHAHELVEGGKLGINDFQTMVLAYSDNHGWMWWPVHQLEEGSEEEARRKIVAFKDRLTMLGKEAVFFRWIELVQYEGSLEGGITSTRQDAVIEKARQLFRGEGIDFEAFLDSVGGLEAFPGLELTPN